MLPGQAQVSTLPRLGKIEVYTDHNPPHFHITGEKIDLKFDVKSLDQIGGKLLNSKQLKNLKKWYFEQSGKEKIFRVWNERNPDNQV